MSVCVLFVCVCLSVLEVKGLRRRELEGLKKGEGKGGLKGFEGCGGVKGLEGTKGLWQSSW